MRDNLNNVVKLVLLFTLSIGLWSCTRGSKDKLNEINISVSANVKGMDPIYASDSYSNTLVAQIFEPLMHYHYLKRPLELEPLVADSMPTVSKDGLVHTFKIKKGVLFHDSEIFPGGKGRELVASDFIFSFKRLADPELQSDGFWIFDGKIVGLNEWRDKRTKKQAKFEDSIEGLTAPDKHTLVIKLTKPFYQLHYVLTMGYTAAVPHEAITKYGKEFLNKPVGTGPFKFDRWIKNSKIELVRNPTWRGDKYPTEGAPGDKEAGLLDDAGKKMPFADRLVVHEIIESQPNWLNFMRGNLDAAGIPKDNFDTAVVGNKLNKEMVDKGISLIINKEPDVTYVAFNMDDPVLGKNADLRKAMSLAYSTEAIIKQFYNGRAISAQSPIPPAIDSYQEDYKNPYKDFNLKKAMEHLKKAGYPGGKGLPEFEYSSLASTTSRQMSEHFKESMAKIGVKIKISSSSWPQFNEKVKAKKAQMWGIAWMADYPDAENFYQLLYGPNESPGSNSSNFKNPEFDKLFKQASFLPPGPKRTALYVKMRDIFVDQAPWIPGAHRLGYLISHKWYKNLKRHSIINDVYKYRKVDTKLKVKLKAAL